MFFLPLSAAAIDVWSSLCVVSDAKKIKRKKEKTNLHKDLKGQKIDIRELRRTRTSGDYLQE